MPQRAGEKFLPVKKQISILAGTQHLEYGTSSGYALTSSSACVPMEPVDPKILMERIKAFQLAPYSVGIPV